MPRAGDKPRQMRVSCRRMPFDFSESRVFDLNFMVQVPVQALVLHCVVSYQHAHFQIGGLVAIRLQLLFCQDCMIVEQTQLHAKKAKTKDEKLQSL